MFDSSTLSSKNPSQGNNQTCVQRSMSKLFQYSFHTKDEAKISSLLNPNNSLNVEYYRNEKNKHSMQPLSVPPGKHKRSYHNIINITHIHLSDFSCYSQEKMGKVEPLWFLGSSVSGLPSSSLGQDMLHRGFQGQPTVSSPADPWGSTTHTHMGTNHIQRQSIIGPRSQIFNTVLLIFFHKEK